jgi:O-phosphoseryl-tRNA(Cys) synthetase
MIEVEHYLTQENHKEKALIYSNMLGVCNGFTQGDIHCDKSKKEEFKILNPHHAGVESMVTYSLDGTILATKDNADVFYDLNNILNLNSGNLKKARQSAIDVARGLLIKKHPIKQWTKALIQKEIDAWKSKNEKGQYRQFCQIAIWFWEEQMKRKRYPAK